MSVEDRDRVIMFIFFFEVWEGGEGWRGEVLLVLRFYRFSFVWRRFG